MKPKKIGITAVLLIVAFLVTGVAYAAQPIEIIVDGQKLTPKTPAQIINGHTMVPIRFVAEALDAEVSWDGNYNRVIIETKKAPAWNLVKLNGEPTTWPYWYEDGKLYLEQRNAMELLRTKFKGPWYSVYFFPNSNTVSISGKEAKVETKQIGEFTVISINSLEKASFLPFTWDPETANITLEK